MVDRGVGFGEEGFHLLVERNYTHLERRKGEVE
jgi:hypothetical protein